MWTADIEVARAGAGTTYVVVVLLAPTSCWVYCAGTAAPFALDEPGQVAVVYWEAEKPQRALRQLAEPQEQFAVWFRPFVQNVHGLDFAQEGGRLPLNLASAGRLAKAI